MKVQPPRSIGSACRQPVRWLLARLAGVALATVMAGMASPALGASGSAARAEAPSLTGWKPVGQIMLIDVPGSTGVVLDVNPFRPGVQTLAVVLHNQGLGRVRFSTLLGRVLGEAPDGGFVPAGTLGAGWRAFAWGKNGGVARAWTPVFDTGLALASVDPALPCRTAADASTPLAGSFDVTIPLGAKPGGKSVPSPTTAFVFGNPAGGVRIATAGGVTLGQKGSGNTAQGGFALAGAVFAYGTSSSKPTLWTPALLGTSSQLVATGFVGCVSAPPPFDGSATPVLDEASAESATIGRDGGSLAAGGVTLTVPAGALSEDVEITMTPISDLLGSPLQGSVIGAARLEPDGLLFLKPALLTMAVPAGLAPHDVLGFGSGSDGSDLHLEPRTVAGGTITLELWHFSAGGSSSGGGGAAAAMQGYQPTTAERQAQQRIAAAAAACAAEQGQTPPILDGPACTNLQQEIAGALSAWYANAVRPGLEQAVGASTSQVESALREWLQWRRQVEELLNDLQGPCGSLQSECNQSHELATAAVANMAQRRLQNCTGGTSLASQIRDVSRVADFVIAGGIDLASAGIPGVPGVEGLIRTCAHLRIDVVEFPAVAALFFDNTLRGRVTVDVFSGPDRADVPFTLTVDGASLSTGADGSFETTIHPTAPPLNVPLEAIATEPNFQNDNFTARTSLSRPARARIDLEAISPVAIDPGDTVTLRVRVAGDGMAGANVDLSVSGPGTLDVSSVTTNEQGERLVVYSAPSDASGSATVTASLGDRSDSVTIDIAQSISVSISPSDATLGPGATFQFTASVTGGTNSAVTWTETGGSITQTGLYTAGTSTGNFTVTATSVQDPSVSASATVTIISSSSQVTVSGFVDGTQCVIDETGTTHCSGIIHNLSGDFTVEGSVLPNGSITVHASGSYTLTQQGVGPGAPTCIEHGDLAFDGTLDPLANVLVFDQGTVTNSCGHGGSFGSGLPFEVVRDGAGRPIALDFTRAGAPGFGPDQGRTTGYIVLS